MTQYEFIYLWMQLTEEIKNQLDEILEDSQPLPESPVLSFDTSDKAS